MSSQNHKQERYSNQHVSHNQNPKSVPRPFRQSSSRDQDPRQREFTGIRDPEVLQGESQPAFTRQQTDRMQNPTSHRLQNTQVYRPYQPSFSNRITSTQVYESQNQRTFAQQNLFASRVSRPGSLNVLQQDPNHHYVSNTNEVPNGIASSQVSRTQHEPRFTNEEFIDSQSPSAGSQQYRQASSPDALGLRHRNLVKQVSQPQYQEHVPRQNSQTSDPNRNIAPVVANGMNTEYQSGNQNLPITNQQETHPRPNPRSTQQASSRSQEIQNSIISTSSNPVRHINRQQVRGASQKSLTPFVQQQNTRRNITDIQGHQNPSTMSTNQHQVSTSHRVPKNLKSQKQFTNQQNHNLSPVSQQPKVSFSNQGNVPGISLDTQNQRRRSFRNHHSADAFKNSQPFAGNVPNPHSPRRSSGGAERSSADRGQPQEMTDQHFTAMTA